MTMFASSRELLTVRDAARWIKDQTGVGPSIETIHRWMRKGVRGRILSARRIGGIWYVSPGDLSSFIFAHSGRGPVDLAADSPVLKATGPSPVRQRQIKEAVAEANLRFGRNQ